ncbi:MAG: YcaQ family DNA glycosylase [Candidatus Zixiibacteriota bacterium]|nr:MAG: YcaQ family DNA glycosylase [candidate division Zixibacteria bacterium]
MRGKQGNITITIQQARRIAINAQLLDGNAKLPRGKEGAAQVVEKLGYIQIDTLTVIERAHHHTLWTRITDYQPDMLDKLLSKDRRIFEYLGHARSYLPMTDYRYYLPRMKRLDDPYLKWEKARLAKYGPYLKKVLKRIRDEGPLGPGDFAPVNKTKGPWSGGRDPNTSAMELLHLQGDLMISERRNFERVFDLTERVLPKNIDTSMPDDNELGRFFVKRALSAYGIATEKEIREHIHAVKKEPLKKAIDELIESGEVVAVTIDSDSKSVYYALKDQIESGLKLKKATPRVHLLSPFDNFIIQRDRISELFGFDYALECYVTPKKRKFGYFAVPILWDGQFAGKLDPKADRKSKTLLIQNLAFEKDLTDYDRFLPQFAKKLHDYARFNQCEQISLNKLSPAKVKREVARVLKM